MPSKGRGKKDPNFTPIPKTRNVSTGIRRPEFRVGLEVS